MSDAANGPVAAGPGEGPLSVEVYDRLDSIGGEDWGMLFSGHPDSFEMCRLVGAGGMRGFWFGSIVVRRGSVPILFVPVFETEFELASLVDGFWARVARAGAGILRRMFRPRLLGVGFVEGEWGAVGVRAGVDAGTMEEAWSLARRTLDDLARRRRSDIVLMLNFPAGETSGEWAEGYSEIEAYPCARVALPYRDVEGYVASLSKGMRRDLRRKLKSAERVAIVRVNDAGEWLDQIYELYRRTVEDADLALGIQERGFFERVCREVPGGHYVLYLSEGKLIGFNLLVVNGGVLVDKYFGMEPEVGRGCNLYFVSWMENVRYCLENGLGIYHAGPGAEGTKVRLGATFVPCVTRFRHRNRVVHGVLRALRPLLAYKTEVEIESEILEERGGTHVPRSVGFGALAPMCLNGDGSVVATQPLVSRCLREVLNLRDLENELRLCGSKRGVNELRERIRGLREQHGEPWLTFIGSGDFHYLSLLLLETLPEAAGPVTLVLIDNHPDWFAEWPKYHCGNWVSSAMKLERVRGAVMLGQDSDDFRWYRSARAPYEALRTGKLELRPLRMERMRFPLRWRTGVGMERRGWGSEMRVRPMKRSGVPNAFAEVAAALSGRNVYLSVDKDCLREADAVTDWEQGGLTLEELTAGISELARRCNIVGADVCGERAPGKMKGFFKKLDAGRMWGGDEPRAGWEQLNERANLAIMKALKVAMSEGTP